MCSGRCCCFRLFSSHSVHLLVASSLCPIGCIGGGSDWILVLVDGRWLRRPAGQAKRYATVTSSKEIDQNDPKYSDESKWRASFVLHLSLSTLISYSDNEDADFPSFLSLRESIGSKVLYPFVFIQKSVNEKSIGNSVLPLSLPVRKNEGSENRIIVRLAWI